jgi:hypothetical protein
LTNAEGGAAAIEGGAPTAAQPLGVAAMFPAIAAASLAVAGRIGPVGVDIARRAPASSTGGSALGAPGTISVSLRLVGGADETLTDVGPPAALGAPAGGGAADGACSAGYSPCLFDASQM